MNTTTPPIPPPLVPPPPPPRQIKKRMTTAAVAILKAFAQSPTGSLRPSLEQITALLAEIHQTCLSEGDQAATTKHIEDWFRRERERQDPNRAPPKPKGPQSKLQSSAVNPNPAYPSLTAEVLRLLETSWENSKDRSLQQRRRLHEEWKCSSLLLPQGAMPQDISRWIEDKDNGKAKLLRVDTTTAPAAPFDFGMMTPTMSDAMSTSPEPASAATSTSTPVFPTYVPRAARQYSRGPYYRPLTPSSCTVSVSASLSPAMSTTALPAVPQFPRSYRPPTPSSRAPSLALKSESAGSPFLPAIATLEPEPDTKSEPESEPEPVAPAPAPADRLSWAVSGNSEQHESVFPPLTSAVSLSREISRGVDQAEPVAPPPAAAFGDLGRDEDVPMPMCVSPVAPANPQIPVQFNFIQTPIPRLLKQLSYDRTPESALHTASAPESECTDTGVLILRGVKKAMIDGTLELDLGPTPTSRKQFEERFALVNAHLDSLFSKLESSPVIAAAAAARIPG